MAISPLVLIPSPLAPTASPSTGEPFWPDGSTSFDGWNHTTSANRWDCVVFTGKDQSWGPFNSPGVCEVHAEPHYKHDRKSAKGKQGANLTMAGREASDVRMRFYIWTDYQWQMMQTLIKHIWPTPKSVPSGLTGTALQNAARALNPLVTASHPALAVVGVADIVIVAVSAPQPGRTHGEMVVEMRGIEYFPPQKGSGTKPVVGGVAVTPSHTLDPITEGEEALYGGNAPPSTDYGPTGTGPDVLGLPGPAGPGGTSAFALLAGQG